MRQDQIGPIVVPEDTRRRLTRIIAQMSWWLALIMTGLRTMEVIPEPFGIIIVMLIGIAIASGLSLSRMRLQGAVLGAFKAGLKAQEAHYNRVLTEAVEDAVAEAQRIVNEAHGADPGGNGGGDSHYTGT